MLGAATIINPKAIAERPPDTDRIQRCVERFNR